jgi:hypothetical protein
MTGSSRLVAGEVGHRQFSLDESILTRLHDSRLTTRLARGIGMFSLQEGGVYLSGALSSSSQGLGGFQADQQISQDR